MNKETIEAFNANAVFNTSGKKLFWIGPRESDIQGLESIFSGSITLYGSGKGDNISYCSCHDIRINHNIDHPDSSAFILEQQLSCIRQDPDCRFMSYNPNYTYGAPEEVVSRTICLNPASLLELLNNKQTFRDFVSCNIPELPMLDVQVRSGKDCKYSALQAAGLWTDAGTYIIQETISSGGQGTFYLSRDNENAVLPLLDLEQDYLVSGYIASNIPLNLHAVLYDDSIVFFPGSVQIIVRSGQRLLYRGADFSTFRALPDHIKNQFLTTAQPLCGAIQRLGYRGVLGVDGIWTERGIFILEVNNRFQGSTHLLNRALADDGLPSVQACTIDAFRHASPNCKSRLESVYVPYSSFTQIYENAGFHSRYLLECSKRAQAPFEVLSDGYRPDQLTQEYACQYTMVFQTNVLSLCDGDTAVRLHPNLPAPEQDWHSAIQGRSLTMLKISLANQGTVILPEATDYIQAHGGMREGTYFSLDLVVDGVYMNTPLSVKFAACSPYALALRPDRSGLCLLYYGLPLTDVDYDRRVAPAPQTADGTPMDRIGFLATDRLRLQNNSYCTFPYHGIGCRFCEIMNVDQKFTLAHILETIDYWFSLSPRPFRHILIGGASNEPGQEQDTILAMCRRIRSYSEMPIYLMCLPPQRKEDVEAYAEAGITEFAFNMELYDRSLARRYMPGKGRIPREWYLRALEWAAECVERTGAVRCSFIAGLEPMSSLLEGIEAVCRRGAAPILSPFRPIPFTEMAEVIPPSNKWLLELTERAEDICRRYGLTLGPSCPACRNNTLTLVQAGEALDVRKPSYPEFGKESR